MNTPSLDELKTFVDIDLVTPEGLVKNTSITVDGNSIHSIGESHGREISMSGYLVMPGLVNSHTHSPMNFLRDLCHGQENMIDNIFFKTESQLNSKLTQDLSYPYILSGIKSGVTTFVEHYYHMDGIAKAFDEVGARAFIGETLADLGGAFPDKDCLKHFKDSIKMWNYSDRIKPVICPHATDTVSKELALEIADFAKQSDIPLHFHLAQREEELKVIKEKYNKTPVELADEWGWLNERTLAVHLLHVNDKDIHTLKKSKATVVSCPSSQILYEFLAPVEKFYKEGLNITLGTDCAASNDEADILSELKVLALLLRDRGIKDEKLYYNLFKSVTSNPASVLNSKIGEIKEGNFADLVFVKKSLDTLPLRDIWTHILFSYGSQHVDHVMVNGEFVLYDQKLCNINEDDLIIKFNDALSSVRI